MVSNFENKLPVRSDIPEEFKIISMLNIPGIAHFNTDFGRLYFSTALYSSIGDCSLIKPGVCFLLFPGDGVLELQVVKNIDDFTIEFEDGVIETHDILGQSRDSDRCYFKQA